ncbi:MAG: DUF429 domain-containing protein [Caulobacterales bacterium]
MRRVLGIDFSGSVEQWRPRRANSNVWLAFGRVESDRLVIDDLKPVQALEGEGAPFERLGALLRQSDLVAAIDASFSVPKVQAADAEQLWATVAALPRGRRPFAEGRKLVDALSPGAGVHGAKLYRQVEEEWRKQGLNVRSGLWCGPRGGAAFSVACMTLLAGHPGPIWPFRAGGEGATLAETYPAAQLLTWGLSPIGYNGAGKAATAARLAILETLVRNLGLRASDEHFKLCASNADALDAVICAYAAAALAQGRHPRKLPPAARSEGWIVLDPGVGGRPLRRTVKAGGNHLFDRLLAGARDHVALEAGDRRLTYAELDRETARLANTLKSLAVRPGDRIAVQVRKSVANLILYLASVRVGAVYLPLNTDYTLAELAYFIGDAEPALIVCDPAVREGVEAIAGEARVATLDAAGEGSLMVLADLQDDVFEPAQRAEGDLAAICYTSGTTGQSKGAMLTHGNLVANAATLRDLWRFTDRDVLIHALPIYHVHGLFIATNVILMAGGTIRFLPRFDPGAVLAAMPGATAMMGVPTFYTRLLQHPGLTKAASARMRLFISGSAPLLAETHRAFVERTGHAILERYGMTETGMNTSNPYDGRRIAGTVGFPLPDVTLQIADPLTGAVLPQGQIGVIEVKGPNVFAGYWKMPLKTADAFRSDGFFVTGDLGMIDARGYVSIVGRDKDLIISGGLNVYPKEVEAEIDALPGVVESAVIGLPHADFGEAVTAVVATGGASDLSESAVIRGIAERLATFKRPKRVVFVDDLPRNAMGKVQKALLRERYAALYR